MTTLQIRIGDQSVIVQAAELTFSANGVFKLIGEGDRIILEALENASSASPVAEEAEATIAERDETIKDQARTIQALRNHLHDLQGDLANQRSTIAQRTMDYRRVKDQLREATEAGENFWNDFIQSENPKTPNQRYRVSLYRLESGNIRGICQCVDYHLWGAGRLDRTYRCKHIDKGIQMAKAAATRVNGIVG